MSFCGRTIASLPMLFYSMIWNLSSKMWSWQSVQRNDNFLDFRFNQKFFCATCHTCATCNTCATCTSTSNWLMEEILRIRIMSEPVFVIIIPAMLLPSENFYWNKERSYDNLLICINGKPIILYLFHDSVHITKNIRNNLLNRKRLIFPPFSCDCLKDFPLELNDEGITWALLHKVHEKDQQCQANQRAEAKLTATVLHPGNWKQNVPAALAEFHSCVVIGPS